MFQRTNNFSPFSILFFLCHLVCCTEQKFACTLLKSDATVIHYQLLSLWKLHIGYFLAITIAVHMPSTYIVSYHRQLHTVWYSVSRIKVATLLCIISRLTICVLSFVTMLYLLRSFKQLHKIITTHIYIESVQIHTRHD